MFQIESGRHLATMADWDAEDFEPDVKPAASVAKVTDKWDGEDEDDDCKVGKTWWIWS